MEKEKESAAELYAVFENGGKQHIARLGQQLILDRLGSKVGEEISFSNVLLLSNHGHTEIGAPYVEGQKIQAEVMEHGRGEKIRVIKFKRRKHYLRRGSTRSSYTKVQIVSIGAAKLEAKSTAKSAKDSAAKSAKVAVTGTVAEPRVKPAQTKEAKSGDAKKNTTAAKPEETADTTDL